MMRFFTKKYSPKFLLIMMGICLVHTSCFEEPPYLNANDRKLIDSLFKDERKELVAVLDSICDTTFNARVALAVDSIMIKRKKEIERLKGTTIPKNRTNKRGDE